MNWTLFNFNFIFFGLYCGMEQYCNPNCLITNIPQDIAFSSDYDGRISLFVSENNDQSICTPSQLYFYDSFISQTKIVNLISLESNSLICLPQK